MADPTIIQTATSANLYATNEQPIDMLGAMLKSYPELAPLVTIMTRLSMDEAFNSRVDWTESHSLPDKIVITGTPGTGTTLTTTQYTYLRNHDVLFNPRTREVYLVNDTTFLTDADGAITVDRGWGETTAVANVVGDEVYRIGTAYPEASEDTEPRHVVNENFYNFTQEFDQTTRHSRRTMNEKTHFGGKGTKRDEDNRKLLYDFRKGFERGVLFGTRANAIAAGGTQYTKTFGGMVEKLYNGSHYFDVNGVLTESKIDNWLGGIYEEHPDVTNLVWVMAPKVYRIVMHMLKPLIRLSPNSKRYGLNLKQYDGDVTVDLVKHPLLTGDIMSGWSFVLDLSYWSIAYQEKPKLELNVAMKRFNYVEDQLYALASVRGGVESRHGMMVGVQG